MSNARTVASPIAVGVLDGLGRLGQRRDERQMIDLLQAAGAPAALGGPAAEHDDRRAVGAGAGDRAHPVGHPGPGGQRADARGPRRLRPALGGEGGGLLVADVDDLDALLPAAVVEAEEMAAGEREEVGDAASREGPWRPACRRGARPGWRPRPQASSRLPRTRAYTERTASTGSDEQRGCDRAAGANRRTGRSMPFRTRSPSVSMSNCSLSRSRVASVSSRLSPVSRVSASTRAATLTASPMTLKLSLPAAADRAGHDLARVEPDPDLEASAPPLAVDEPIDLERRAHRPIGVVGDDLRGPEDRHQAVALELVDVAALGRDRRDDDLEERVEPRDDLLGAGGLGEAA